MVTTKQYYYHITQKRWSNKKILKPRSYGANRGHGEPDDLRICVAPTIEGCLLALGSCLEYYKTTYVYRTSNKVIAKKPYEVDDAKITGEMWLIRPTTFDLYGRVILRELPETLLNIQVGDHDAFNDQRYFKRELLKNRDWFIKIPRRNT
jgi:hypothetical protein